MWTLADDDRRGFATLIDELAARGLHDALHLIGPSVKVNGQNPLAASQRLQRIGRVRKRGLEFPDGLHPLRIRDEHVVRIERQGEEAPLIGIADDEKLFGSRLTDERPDVRAHPADLRSDQLQERQRHDAVPLVRFLVLEMDEVEDVHGHRQIGPVQPLDGIEVVVIEHAHRAGLVRGARARHGLERRGVPRLLVAPTEVR